MHLLVLWCHMRAAIGLMLSHDCSDWSCVVTRLKWLVLCHHMTAVIGTVLSHDCSDWSCVVTWLQWLVLCCHMTPLFSGGDTPRIFWGSWAWLNNFPYPAWCTWLQAIATPATNSLLTWILLLSYIHHHAQIQRDGWGIDLDHRHFEKKTDGNQLFQIFSLISHGWK